MGREIPLVDYQLPLNRQPTHSLCGSHQVRPKCGRIARTLKYRHHVFRDLSISGCGPETTFVDPRLTEVDQTSTPRGFTFSRM